MKKSFALLLLSIIIMLANNLLAQNDIKLDATSNGRTYYQCDRYIYDKGGPNGNHGNNYNYSLTICSSRTPGQLNPNRMSLTFEDFNIGDGDVFRIFDGRSINNPAAQLSADMTFDFTDISLLGRSFMSSLQDTTGCLSIQFVSDNAGDNTGFKAKIECVARCQFPVASLDTFFIKYDKLGNMTNYPVRNGIDSIYSGDDSTLSVVKFKSVDICYGDSIKLVAKPIFPENDNTYHQSIENCIYYWQFGDGTGDTTNYINTVDHRWASVDGYDLTLLVLDTNLAYSNNVGCKSRNTIDTRLRISRNPIKTVAPLPDMCSGQNFKLNVGYTGNSSVIIDSLEFSKQFKEMFDSTVFIPDGPQCGAGAVGCYESPVYFDQFRPGSVITTANDIISCCINMEHSFIGDLSIFLECPTGQIATIKAFPGGGGMYVGLPYGGGNHGTYDFTGAQCTAPPNLAGTGWWYCFSNLRATASSVILTNCPSVIASDPTVLAVNCTTCDSTHRADSSNYYRPDNAGQDFSTLVGCPMNGQWKVRVCDQWGIDNGFVFAWYMELGMTGGANWEYQVPLDTVIWDGPFMHDQTSNTSIITPPIDSCDTYRYDIHIIDDFNCVWDTATSLAVVCTPVINLGPDTAICEQMNVFLDAGNPGATEYIWEPTGETTQTIVAKTLPNSDSKITYVAQVTNFNGSLYCYGTDSINLTVYPSALASFSMDKNPLEGCEPLSFQLFSSSTNAAQYDWTVGQLKSNEPNPSFTFPYGTYDLKLKVTSDKGCTDSIFQESIINVYKSPIADFGWNPTNPAVSNPTINFINLTTPVDYSNQYHWKIQSNKLNDLRENIFGFEPTYTWVPIPGANTVGNYNITLDAYSVNNAPSGRTYECHDTISKIITIINDSIMFPNVLTPNGDGVNDVLIIKNLLDGQSYPDNELSIFNRNGKRIFFKQDIRTNQEIWDPAKTNTPTGTYFYKFIGRGPIRNIEYNGTIEILR